MPKPRKLLVDPTRTLYYHVTSRCVRRAFLCGSDRVTGVSYEHRREWIEQRLRLLSSIFAIEICAYAVMSNHYHIVLKLKPQEGAEWTNREVLDRWRCIYRGPKLLERAVRGESLSVLEVASVNEMLKVYRSRLSSLSWFMKALNEPIAKMANKEDNCTGHFWESRFRSQALFTTASLIACMAYVDLNPVRAGLSSSALRSDYTSIKERIDPTFDVREALTPQFKENTLRCFDLDVRPLMKFARRANEDTFSSYLPISLRQYIGLLEYTAAIGPNGHRKPTPRKTASVIRSLHITPDEWLIDAFHFETLYTLGAFRPPYELALGIVAGSDNSAVNLPTE